MKKISVASFIVALVLIVASIALFVLGFLFVNTPQVYSNVGHGYSFMRLSYSFSLTDAINGFMFILLGGFLFIGGLLLLLLAAVTHPLNSKKCSGSKKPAPVVVVKADSSENSSSDAPETGAFTTVNNPSNNS